MFKEDETKDIVIEYVEMIRRKANIVFTKKFELVIIELPKFKKSIEELSNITDKWLYSITHIEELTSCPEVMANDEIMKELYETARINKLTNEEMDLYKQSVIEYDDVRDAMEYAKEEAFAEGRVEGQVEERNRFVKNLYSIKWSLKHYEIQNRYHIHAVYLIVPVCIYCFALFVCRDYLAFRRLTDCRIAGIE